jgi:hypothetical protein
MRLLDIGELVQVMVVGTHCLFSKMGSFVIFYGKKAIKALWTSSKNLRR